MVKNLFYYYSFYIFYLIHLIYLKFHHLYLIYIKIKLKQIIIILLSYLNHSFLSL